MTQTTSAAIGAALWASNGISDPRKGVEAFNYGPALGSPKGNPEWDAFERVRDALGDVAVTFSSQQWKLEEAARAVRHAVTPGEQREAMTAYRVTFHAVDRTLETVKAGPLAFFRFGRVGNVLQRFNPFA